MGEEILPGVYICLIFMIVENFFMRMFNFKAVLVHLKLSEVKDYKISGCFESLDFFVVKIKGIPY